ncbi:glucokinase [Falsiroseomonas sp. CW058]|uniref:glucokinase n=1 Tax=Falsiroseomonas sp. CW058 TaxID=3388664 RepID=UPI003D317D78
MKALLADIGGTNARFALLDGGAVGAPLVMPVAAHPTAEAAIATALAQLAPGGGVRRAVLALAGPVLGEPVRLTNAPWAFSRPGIAARFGLDGVTLVNDFAALAHALPHLGPGDLLPLGEGGGGEEDAPMLVLGPGTGLGMAAFLRREGRAMPTEAGHIGLGPADPWQDRVVAALRERCGRAGVEEAVSGRGLANLHAVVAALRGAAVPARDAAGVVAAAGACPVAEEAVGLFLDLLANFAGDMALAWGARGGVFLAGGILPRLATRLDPRAFRARFEDRAPMRDWMRGVPLFLVTHPAPAFPGLAALARAGNG